MILNDRIETPALLEFEVLFGCNSEDISRPINRMEKILSNVKRKGSPNDININNDNDKDIYVKVVDSLTQKAIRTIYIWKYGKATVHDLPAGTYFLVVAYGSHWDKRKLKFRCDKSFAAFDRPQDYMRFSAFEYNTWEMRLYEEFSTTPSSGPKTIFDFEKY